MKNIKIHNILFITLLLTLINCSKDKAVSKNEYFIATIGVQKVEFNHIQTIFTNSFEPPYKLLDIFASSANGSSIRISQPAYLATESHYERSNASENLLAFEYVDKYDDIFITGRTYEILDPGTLDITEETDTYIKGTFSFIAHNNENEPVPVSDGSFLVFK